MKYARAIRDASDHVIKVISYEGAIEFESTDHARAMGYEVLYNNG